MEHQMDFRGKFSTHATIAKNAIHCAIHGKTHLVLHQIPNPGDFFPSRYVCAQCVREYQKGKEQ